MSWEEDNGLLDAPFRQPDEICRHYSVRKAGNIEQVTSDDQLVCRYMNDTAVLESGTHDELMEAKGDYARLWKLQAEAFK
jgi:hypothetical protein